jgi:hypothetical protein
MLQRLELVAEFVEPSKRHDGFSSFLEHRTEKWNPVFGITG